MAPSIGMLARSWIIVLVGLAGLCLGAPAARAAAILGPPSQELQEALAGLSSPDTARRGQIYKLFEEKGDSRLIPALHAFVDGRLQNVDHRLVIYGDKVDVPGKGSGFPLLDAFTLQPIKAADGTDEYYLHPHIDLSAPGMMRLPAARRVERARIADLTSMLSLLDPDPKARLSSIRDVADRAARVFVAVPEQQQIADAFAQCRENLSAAEAGAKSPADAAFFAPAISALAAGLADQAQRLSDPIPDSSSVGHVSTALRAVQSAMNATPPPAWATPALALQLDTTLRLAMSYRADLEIQEKHLDELKKYDKALEAQLAKDPGGPFASGLHESLQCMDVAIGDPAAAQRAIGELGSLGTERAANILDKAHAAAVYQHKDVLADAAATALAKASRRQSVLSFVEASFAGLSLGSILVLLALGLSIVFGLMGVINMAHGEFMMIGAFTTYVVSSFFHNHLSNYFDWYLVAAIPCAFFVSGFIGYLCEVLIIRHLYGRPLETLLATWGLGLILIQSVRVYFGSNLSVTPPGWMEGGVEVVPDLVFPLNRLYIIVYCVLCIAMVYAIVNYTKLGLLLRATTQNRAMAASLGVATRRIDGLTFALGCGLAGLAGVAVPLYNKINPDIGQEYIVDSFMVVVVGGVGALSGAIWAGFALGVVNKYLEPLLEKIPSMASGASVIGKVLVLALIIAFLQWKPAGLFPPKGRLADA